MKGAGGAMGGKNPMSFGKSKARLIPKDESNITFKDVALVQTYHERVMHPHLQTFQQNQSLK
jgi:cell division protease FtsH